MICEDYILLIQDIFSQGVIKHPSECFLNPPCGCLHPGKESQCENCPHLETCLSQFKPLRASVSSNLQSSCLILRQSCPILIKIPTSKYYQGSTQSSPVCLTRLCMSNLTELIQHDVPNRATQFTKFSSALLFVLSTNSSTPTMIPRNLPVRTSTVTLVRYCEFQGHPLSPRRQAVG